MTDPKEQDNEAKPLKPVQPYIQSRRLDVMKVTIEFGDGEVIEMENGDWVKMACYREYQNGTRVGQGPIRQWVEYDVSWSVEMVKDERERWVLPE